MNCYYIQINSYQDATVATSNVGVSTSKVGVVKLSMFLGRGKSSSLKSESGVSLRDSIRDSCTMYFVNSSKLTLPSSSIGVCVGGGLGVCVF